MLFTDVLVTDFVLSSTPALLFNCQALLAQVQVLDFHIKTTAGCKCTQIND